MIDYASQDLNVYLKDMALDSDGHPVLLYLTSRGHEPGPPNDPREFRITRWDGNRWRTDTITQGDHNYDMGSLDLSPGRWRAYLPAAPGPQPYHAGGEVELWESQDRGESWSRLRSLTRDSERNHNYVRRPLAARDPFFVFWADGDPTQPSRSWLHFANSSGARVWRLPYEMGGEWAEPERVFDEKR